MTPALRRPWKQPRKASKSEPLERATTAKAGPTHAIPKLGRRLTPAISYRTYFATGKSVIMTCAILSSVVRQMQAPAIPEANALIDDRDARFMAVSCL